MAVPGSPLLFVPASSQVFRLWIDGVGSYLVCLGDQVTIGSPAGTTRDQPEIAIWSNLSRNHARLVRRGEFWVLEPLGVTQVDGCSIAKPVVLQDGNLLELGQGVELRFRLPSRLSGTARIEFISRHRVQSAVDGVILLAETCVMEDTGEAHIPFPAGAGRVLLMKRAGVVWCRSARQIEVNGVSCGTDVACAVGAVYSGDGWRFRWEGLES